MNAGRKLKFVGPFTRNRDVRRPRVLLGSGVVWPALL